MPTLDINNSAQTKEQAAVEPQCYHCGLPCDDPSIHLGDKYFCCRGCLVVYELLSENGLCQYYSLNDTPGITPTESGYDVKYAYLDDESILRELLNFTDGKTARATFYVPQMHCSSCIWLLENLHKINSDIISSRVDFLRKEISINFKIEHLTLKKLVELLASLGYEPDFQTDIKSNQSASKQMRSLYLKLGVAGFAFGNIMLLSFPEYLSGGNLDPVFKQFFGFINILLALPVFLYSSSDYFTSAWKALRHKNINIDLPISLGIITLFTRSLWEIFSGNGAGYMDSFVALVFLLLIGRLFQQKTYETLSFDRDYKSFFPISVVKRIGREETSIPLNKLQVGDRIVVRNQELIPADSILISGPAEIDYSFVTGEAYPVHKKTGDLIYAGGRQAGPTIELDVIKPVSQSYLTQLWNNEAFNRRNESRIDTMINRISKYFTLAVISIASLSALYWLPTDVGLALNAFTAVLIIACPCALALASPFTLGNTLRILGRNRLFLKSVRVIEDLAKISTIVFDKTGTLTQRQSTRISFIPDTPDQALSELELKWIASLVRHSSHPLSQQIRQLLAVQDFQTLEYFTEFPGKGIEGKIEGRQIKVGSPEFIGLSRLKNKDTSSKVYVSIDDQARGYFQIENQYRPAFSRLITYLKSHYELAVLSGDNDAERTRLASYFPDTNLKFNQSPQDKLEYIKTRQDRGEHVLMVGDGLNDAGALRQSDVGVTMSEDLNTFSPACDAILDATNFEKLDVYLKYTRKSMKIVIICFGISFLYNLVGLTFAVQGVLSPLVSAILMPLSSISVIVFSTGATHIIAKKLGLIQNSFLDIFTSNYSQEVNT